MEELLLPLFPLEIVLLPQELLPLHIFEDRYQEMVGECLRAKAAGSGQQEFGILQQQSQEVAPVGCSARIINVTHQYADGRMDILTAGSRRFEVLYTNQEKSYLRGGVDFFDDEPGADTPDENDSARAITLFGETIRRLRRSKEIPVHLPPPHRHLSFRIAGSLPLDLSFKQNLLGLRDESDRLRHVMEAMVQVIEQIARVEDARRRAGGNGDSHPKT